MNHRDRSNRVSLRLGAAAAVAAAWACAAPVTGAPDTVGSQWTIVATYPVPEGASGLAWDGTWLYCGIYGVNGGNIYRIDPTDGSFVLLFTGPHEDAYGLTFDGTNLWTTDHPGFSDPGTALKLDWDGTVLDQFDLPDHYMSGIAYEAGDFWVTRYHPNPGRVYQLDGTGAVLDEFDGPDDQPWDLCFENGNLWIADYWGDTLYKVDPVSGALLESHPSEGVDPAGIVWDGQHLWYCDNGEGGVDFLYKVDLQGTGTPQIELPAAEHDYGPVAIGDSKLWEVTVNNTGSADLEITGVDFGGNADLSSPTTFPVTVPMGGTTLLSIVYGPSSFGPLDATVHISSNDPIHAEEPVALTGDGVYPGPTIDLSSSSHDYGAVRLNAHTRWFLEISNHGNQVLTISDITSDDPRFFLDEGADVPMALATLETVQVGVWFSPNAASAFSGTLTVESNDPGLAPVAVALSGSGDPSPKPMGDSLWSFTIDAGFDNSPKAMAAISDVSGDGRPDVIVCSEDDFVRCFNGNAHGTGDALWENDFGLGYAYGQKSIQVIPDISEDGLPDVVVGTAGGQRVVRALSGRTGAQVWNYDTNEYGAGGWVYQVDASHDYNNDGSVDVLAATGDDSTDTGPKRVLCLNGLSGVKLWDYPFNGPVFSVIGVADFTGDGHPDVVAGGSNESESQGRAVGLDGVDGSFEWEFLVGGSSVWALEQLEDVTLDGVPDVLVGDFLTGNLHGVDTSDGTQRYATGGFGIITRLQRLDDVNGDGHPDFVPAHSSDFARVVSGRNGAAAWTTPLADNASSVARIADVSGDGVNDVVVGTLFTSNFSYFLDGIDGSVLHSANYGQPIDAITSMPDVVGDGSWEMVVGGRNGLVTCLSGGTMVAPPCPGDTDDNGAVDIDDIVNVVLCWGTDGIDCPDPGDHSDVDQSGSSAGVVNIDDIVLVVLEFGACPGQ